LIIASLSSLILSQLWNESNAHEIKLANGTYTSRNSQEPAKVIIDSGRVIYANWDRVAGCNLDSKRNDCTLVEKSIRSVGPCMLLWQVPFEDSAIVAPDNEIILNLENCKTMPD